MQTRPDGEHTPHSAQCQVWEARGEHRHDRERQWVAAPRTFHEQVARDGAHAYGAHVERTGGRCVGHCQDDKGFQGIGGDVFI